MGELMRVDDLDVYKKLVKLVMTVHQVTMNFPQLEKYELGSQLHRSSNSIAANLAEGFGNKHANLYTESISRAQGELRETKHYLRIARGKEYISEKDFNSLFDDFEICSKMLFRLERAVNLNWHYSPPQRP